MATRAISAEVKAANSKIAQFLRRQEEEENILQIGKKKPKQTQEERLPSGRGRWQLEPDWKAPTPMVDRPRTIAGATSFHFSYITVSKQGVPTVKGAPVSGTFGTPRNAALEHSKYIERDGAAEVSQGPGADHAAYVERPEVIENIDPAGPIAEARERELSAVFNETPTAAEAELFGIETTAPEGIPSVFSNISDDPFERQEFWRAVERIEREPKCHQIILEPDVSPAWWRELETTERLDNDFRHHALQVAEEYRQHLAIPFADGERRKPFVAKPFRVTAEEAGRIIQSAQRMANYNDYDPPLEFKSGRGGRIQIRMVAELPYEVTAVDRARIVQNFCDHLSSLQERRNLDGSTYKTGMMYTAAIHAPDAHNDSRNYHLHVVAYDRPCRFDARHGLWDFEIPKVYVDTGSRKERIRYPYRQAKLEDVTRTEEGRDKTKTGINFIPTLRSEFAEINNAVLKARGIKRRLDPRKYSQMGIDRTPTQHLGTKAAALESIGVATTVGQLNAVVIWSDAERQIRRQAVQAKKVYAGLQADLDGLGRQITTVDPNGKHVGEYRSLIAERKRLIADVAADRESVMTFDHMEAKAKSRAIRTRQTCLQFLADLDSGKADRSTKMMRLAIQDRWKGAQQHLESIDRALEPHRAALAKAARDIEAREARIAEIDIAVQPIRAILQGRVDAACRSTGGVTSSAPNSARSPVAPTSTIATPTAAPTTVDVRNPVQPAPLKDRPQSPSERPTVENEDQVSVEPVSIAGLPIIEPTIAPRIEEIADDRAVDRATPASLDPLRLIAPPVLSATAPELVSVYLDPSASTKTEVDQPGIAAGRTSEADGPDLSQDRPHAEDAGAEPAAAEPEADRRRKVEDPVPVELQIQELPIKSGTSEAAYGNFDKIFVRVMDERIPIRAEKEANGNIKFTVPSLPNDQQALLADPRFAKRANHRLGAIEGYHKREVDRLVRWIQTQGQNPKTLLMKDRKAALSPVVTQSVRTLFKHWGRHGDVVLALQTENQRRIELEKQRAAKPVAGPVKVDPDLTTRRAEAAKLYPPPAQAFTPEVAEFLRLLLDAAPHARLREAADKIHESARAREDVNKHTVHLATAYRQHVEGVGQRVAYALRNPNSLGR